MVKLYCFLLYVCAYALLNSGVAFSAQPNTNTSVSTTSNAKGSSQSETSNQINSLNQETNEQGKKGENPVDSKQVDKLNGYVGYLNFKRRFDKLSEDEYERNCIINNFAVEISKHYRDHMSIENDNFIDGSININISFKKNENSKKLEYEINTSIYGSYKLPNGYIEQSSMHNNSPIDLESMMNNQQSSTSNGIISSSNDGSKKNDFPNNVYCEKFIVNKVSGNVIKPFSVYMHTKNNEETKHEELTATSLKSAILFESNSNKSCFCTDKLNKIFKYISTIPNIDEDMMYTILKKMVEHTSASKNIINSFYAIKKSNNTEISFDSLKDFIGECEKKYLIISEKEKTQNKSTEKKDKQEKNKNEKNKDENLKKEKSPLMLFNEFKNSLVAKDEKTCKKYNNLMKVLSAGYSNILSFFTLIIIVIYMYM